MEKVVKSKYTRRCHGELWQVAWFGSKYDYVSISRSNPRPKRPLKFGSFEETFDIFVKGSCIAWHRSKTNFDYYHAHWKVWKIWLLTTDSRHFLFRWDLQLDLRRVRRYPGHPPCHRPYCGLKNSIWNSLLQKTLESLSQNIGSKIESTWEFLMWFKKKIKNIKFFDKIYILTLIFLVRYFEYTQFWQKNLRNLSTFLLDFFA